MSRGDAWIDVVRAVRRTFKHGRPLDVTRMSACEATEIILHEVHGDLYTFRCGSCGRCAEQR